MVELQYEVNGNGLDTLEPFGSSESHRDYYNKSPNAEADVLTLYIHHDTRTESDYALLGKYHDGSTGEDTSYGCRMDWTETVDSNKDIIIKDDDQYAEEYHGTWAGHGWWGNGTDGIGFTLSTFYDVTFTVDTSYDGADGTFTDDTISDFRIVPGPTSSPVYAGTGGSIRLTVEGLQHTTASVGDSVVMLTPDLAHH